MGESQVGKSDKESRSIKVDLEKLVCDRSYDDLEMTLTKLKGIIDIDLDRKMHTVLINYDPAAITDTLIIDKITEVGCRIQEF